MKKATSLMVRFVVGKRLYFFGTENGEGHSKTLRISFETEGYPKIRRFLSAWTPSNVLQESRNWATWTNTQKLYESEMSAFDAGTTYFWNTPSSHFIFRIYLKKMPWYILWHLPFRHQLLAYTALQTPTCLELSPWTRFMLAIQRESSTVSMKHMFSPLLLVKTS